MNVAAMGDTPMSPVMSDPGTVEMPALVRMTKLPAEPRSTGEVAAAVASTRADKRELNIAMEGSK
eukprot:3588006-Heterocapsa_arctica.AAC.1